MEHYYDDARAACMPCGRKREEAVVAIAAILVCAGLLLSCSVASTRIEVVASFVARVRSVGRAMIRISGIRAKMKITVGFYQVVSVLGPIYRARLPQEYKRWMAPFDMIGRLSITETVFPVECLATYITRLTVLVFWPYSFLLVCAALTTLYRTTRAFVAWRYGKAPMSADGHVALWRHLIRAARDGVMSLLPLAIFVTFMVYTSGCAAVFGAFDCESFEFDAASGERHSFLMVDARVRCTPTTPEYDAIRSFGQFCFVIWCVAIPLVYATLLFCARRAILNHQPTLLSIRIGGLWCEYEPRCFWWEPVEMLRKLLLTGAVLLVPEEHVMLRTVIGLLVSVIALVGASIVQPFHSFLDDVLFTVTQLVLVIAFVGVILIDACNEGGQDACKRFGFASSFTVSIWLFTLNITIIVLILVSIVASFLRATKTKTLRLRATNDVPQLQLSEGHRYHTFLSHIWRTGQDQVRVIKSQLLLLMPGIKVFLDVDDLKDSSKLEEYVARSGSVLFFLSRRYFVSRSCLREVSATLEGKKHIVLVNEADRAKGGQTVAKTRAECPVELRARIFDGRNPITWMRIADFQLLSLKLICHEILSATPLYSGRSVQVDLTSASQLRRSTTGPSVLQLGLYVPGELLGRKLTCEQNGAAVVLFCSPNNPGAGAVGAELAAQVGGIVPQDRLTTLAEHQNPTHMLLYLDCHTWLGAAGDALFKDVQAAHAKKLPIVMVHEQDESRSACIFSQLFETTPQALIKGGLYAKIAIPLYAQPHRAVGFAMAGLALGATEEPELPTKLLHASSRCMSEAAAAALATVSAAADEIDLSERLERGVNFLEDATGLDIDRDGHVGGMDRSPTPEGERKSVQFAGSEPQAVVAEPEALATESVSVSETLPSLIEQPLASTSASSEAEPSARRRRAPKTSPPLYASSELQRPPRLQQQAPSAVEVTGASGRTRRSTSGIRVRVRRGSRPKSTRVENHPPGSYM